MNCHSHFYKQLFNLLSTTTAQLKSNPDSSGKYCFEFWRQLNTLWEHKRILYSDMFHNVFIFFLQCCPNNIGFIRFKETFRYVLKEEITEIISEKFNEDDGEEYDEIKQSKLNQMYSLEYTIYIKPFED